MTKSKNYRYMYRSAISGKFVTKVYADANPDTTMRIKVWNYLVKKDE